MHRLLFFFTLPALIVLSFGARCQQVSDVVFDSVAQDFRSFEDHIAKNLVYPEDARKMGRQGVVYVRFLIDNFGHIIPDSVKTIVSLTPSCDREAERVIKLYAKKWSWRRRGADPFVLPIQFVLTDDPLHEFPSYTFATPGKTTVVSKGSSVQNPDWSIYGRKGKENVIGKIAPGDTVVVTGWSAWCYFIQAKNISGYISYRALEKNPSMEIIADIVESRSESEDEIENKFRSPLPLDTIHNFTSETAHLSLTSSKTSLYSGECTTITLAFNVRDDNQLKLQFFDLGPQLSGILKNDLRDIADFVVNNAIDSIVGVEQVIKERKYTTYKIYEAAYCPTANRVVHIPKLKLKMLIRKKHNVPHGDIAEFNTTPFAITIKPLPVTGLTQFAGYRMVGDFRLEEKLPEQPLTSGKPFTYTLTISGEGLTFPLEPPKVTRPGLHMRLSDIHDEDTIIDNVLHSSRTFIYTVVALRDGRYDLRDQIAFTAFNPKTGKATHLHSSLLLNIPKGSEIEPLAVSSKFYSRKNIIAVDASQSMKIEDYSPTRLDAVKTGLREFLDRQKACDIGIIAFGENVLPLHAIDTCNTSIIDRLSFGLVRNGTAIGDAIWFVKLMYDPVVADKKLVIIGDGDNTAGRIDVRYAAMLAKHVNIKIFTIGVGNKGPVPFGRDNAGQPYMIENTFSDVDFRSISHTTGGKYYWAKDAGEVAAILKLIFQEQ